MLSDDGDTTEDLLRGRSAGLAIGTCLYRNGRAAVPFLHPVERPHGASAGRNVPPNPAPTRPDRTRPAQIRPVHISCVLWIFLVRVFLCW